MPSRCLTRAAPGLYRCGPGEGDPFPAGGDRVLDDREDSVAVIHGPSHASNTVSVATAAAAQDARQRARSSLRLWTLKCRYSALT